MLFKQMFFSESRAFTSQKREGTVLQLHDNTFQNWKHGSNVQKEQDDWLAGRRNRRYRERQNLTGWDGGVHTSVTAQGPHLWTKARAPRSLQLKHSSQFWVGCTLMALVSISLTPRTTPTCVILPSATWSPTAMAHSVLSLPGTARKSSNHSCPVGVGFRPYLWDFAIDTDYRD